MVTHTDLEGGFKDSARQVAALVWRKAGPEPEILLVTSRIRGASFLSERRGRGLGVRLKFGRQLAKRIDIWENEGGHAAADDIL